MITNIYSKVVKKRTTYIEEEKIYEINLNISL